MYRPVKSTSARSGSSTTAAAAAAAATPTFQLNKNHSDSCTSHRSPSSSRSPPAADSFATSRSNSASKKRRRNSASRRGGTSSPRHSNKSQTFTSNSQQPNQKQRTTKTSSSKATTQKRPKRPSPSSSSPSIFVREAIFIIHCSRSSTTATHTSTTSIASTSTRRRGRGTIRRHTSLTMELTTIRAHPRRPDSSTMSVPSSPAVGVGTDVGATTDCKRCSSEEGADTDISLRPRKRVHFDTEPPKVFDDDGSDSASSTSSSSTWYSPSEMDSFREVVREAGRKAHIHQLERLAGGHHVRPSSPPPIRDGSDEDDDEEKDNGRTTSRGLDYRSSLERQRNRLIAIRAVLECQRRLRSGQLPATCPSSAVNVSPDVHLALISAKCTRWARELAALIGRRDFYEAYPEFRSELDDDPIPDVSSLNCLKPFPTSLKRSISTGMATARTVAQQKAAADNVCSAKSDGPIGSDSCATPALLTATTIAEEQDSDDEARRRLGVPTKRQSGHKRRREDGASGSSCESGTGASEARSAAAVLAGC